MLTATIELLGADMGDFQLYDSKRGVLTIAAHRGFGKPFLETFREVASDSSSSCGQALRSGQRVIIEDIEAEEAFWALRAVAREAGYRAVQSTPIIARDGTPLGIISTHFMRPHRPGDDELQMLDLYVRQAADFIERSRIDEALKKSEKEFKALAEASSNVIYRMSPDWTEMRRLVGRNFIADTQEPSRTWLQKYIHPDDQPKVTAVIDQAIRTKSIFELEHRVLCLDGSLGWTFSRAIPIFDEAGEIIEWLGMASDVTESKRAEEALQMSEIRYRTLVDATSAVTWSCPPSGLHVEPQPSWMTFTGQKAEEMLGAGWIDAVHPDDLADASRRWNEAVLQGVPFQSEHRIRRHDGQWRWMSVHAVPVHDSEGQLVEWVGMNLDITERKLAEEKLTRSESMLTASQRIGHIGSWKWDILSGKVDWSEEMYSIYGLNPASHDTAVDSYLSFVHPDDRSRIEDEMRRVSLKGGAVDLEYRIQCSDGKIRILRTQGEVTAFDTEGKPAVMTGVEQDITDHKLAEYALRASEAKYRSLFESIDEGVCFFERLPEQPDGKIDFRYITMNRAMQAMFRTEDLSGRTIRESFPHEAETWYEDFETVLKTGEPVRFERESEPQGMILSMFVSRVTGCDGLLMAVMQDITARRRAEVSLRESEERLRLAVRAANIGLFDWDIRTGKVVFSPEYKAQLGYAADELTDDFEEWESRLHPDEVDAILDRVHRTLLSESEPHEIEFRMRHKDGSWRWIFTRAEVYRDSAGTAVRMLGCHLDVTSRRKAEEAIRENQSKLAAILDNAADAIITIDEHGIMESVNRASCLMFGYLQEEMIGRNVSMLMPPYIRNEHDGYLARCLSTGEHKIIGIGRETYARRKDGTDFPIELAVSEIDHLRQFAGIVRDITRRKELEREVVEIASLEQRRIGQDLHDTVSQELTALCIHAANLAESLPEDASGAARIVEKIVQGLRRSQEELRAVMRRLLPILVNGEGIMAAFADLAYRTQNDNELICTFECPEPVTLADNLMAMHLFLIGQEAVHNALKHGDPRNILIRLESNDFIKLTVQDDGKGIDHVHKTTVKSDAGGLGLRIMHNRASIIGAVLMIEPIQPAGTRVTCTLENKEHV